MNLYKITVGVATPKAFVNAMICLVLADHDERVYDWIKSNPQISVDISIRNDWFNQETSDNQFKESIIAMKGDINDEKLMSPTGAILYGWEDLGEVKGEGPDILKEHNILMKL